MPISIHIIKINKKQRLTKAQAFASPVAVVLPICCTIMCLFWIKWPLIIFEKLPFSHERFLCVYRKSRESG